MNIVLFALYVSLGINLVMFVPAFIFKTDKLTDISYAVTFVVVAFAAYSKSEQTALHALLLAMILAWALRLGTFLFIRINKMGKDARFDGMREHFFKFIRFWILQAVTVWVVMLAALYGFKQPITSFNLLSFVGILLFVNGLLLESAADSQKAKFNASKTKKGQWIDVGVWRASRHPNYLGEMLVWIGVYITVVPVLSGWSMLVAILSPLYIVALLLFVSGVPLLEKSADKKWGTDPAYKKYKREVPPVLPNINSIKRALNKNPS